MAVLNLRVLVSSNATQAFGAINTAIGGIGRSAAMATTSVTGMTAGLQGLGQAFVVLQGVRFLGNMVREGLQFNALLQTSRIGIAALVDSFNQISIGGQQITDPIQKFNASLLVAEDIQKRLLALSLKTTASYESLLLAFQEGAGPAFKEKFNVEQVTKFTLSMVQAATAIGLPFNQFGQEIRAVFEGDVSRYSRIARTLIFNGIDDVQGKLKELRREGPEAFFNFVQQRLHAMTIAGELTATTLTGSFSNLREAILLSLGEGTAGTTKNLIDLFNELRDKIIDIDEAGNVTFNDDFVKSVTSVAEAFFYLARGAAAVAEALTKGNPAQQAGAAWGERWYNFVDEQVVAVQQRNQRRNMMTDQGMVSVDPTFGAGEMENFERAVGAGKTHLNEEALEQKWLAEQDPTGNIALKAETAEITRRLVAALKLEADATAEAEKANTKLEKQRQLAAIAAERYTQKLNTLHERLTKDIKDSQFDSLASYFDRMAEGSKNFFEKVNWEKMGEHLENLRDYEKKLDEISKLETDLSEMQNIANLGKKDRNLEAEQQIMAQIIAAKEAAEQAWNAKRIEINNSASDKIWEYWKEEAQKQGEYVIKEWEDDLNSAVEMELSAWLEAEEKAIARIKNLVDGVTDSIKNGFAAAFEALNSGDNPLDALMEQFKGVWTTTLTDMAGGYLTMLSNIAQGKPYAKSPEGGDITMGQAGQRRAQWGVVGIQAVAGAYQLYQQGQQGMSPGANALSGALMGASIGTIVPGVGNVVGFVVGAIVGAIAGYFTGSAGDSFKVHVRNGKISVQAWGDASESDAAAAMNTINDAISKNMEGIRGLFDAFPEAIGDAFEELDLSKVFYEGSQWFRPDALQRFVETDIPQLFFEAYSPIIKGGLSALGLEANKIAEIFKGTNAQGFDPAEWIKKVTDFVKMFVGMQEAAEFLGKSLDDKTTIARGKTPMQRMTDIGSRITDRAEGFESLTWEEQITRGNEIIDLINERYQLELQYLKQIEDASRAIAESTQKLVDNIAMDQMRLGYDESGNPIMDTERQIDFMLGQQRTLFDQLERAGTPEEVARITDQIQQNAMTLYDMMGRTPEAAAQITAQLQSANEIAQQRLAIMRDAVAEADALLKKVLDSILAFLRGLGLDPEDPAGVKPPDPNAPRPVIPGPFKPTLDAWDQANTEVVGKVADLGSALADAGDAVSTFAGIVAGATANMPRESTMQIVAQPVIVPAPNTSIALYGSTAAVTTEVASQVGDKVERRVVRTMSRKANTVY